MKWIHNLFFSLKVWWSCLRCRLTVESCRRRAAQISLSKDWKFVGGGSPEGGPFGRLITTRTHISHIPTCHFHFVVLLQQFTSPEISQLNKPHTELHILNVTETQRTVALKCFQNCYQTKFKWNRILLIQFTITLPAFPAWCNYWLRLIIKLVKDNKFDTRPRFKPQQNKTQVSFKTEGICNSAPGRKLFVRTVWSTALFWIQHYTSHWLAYLLVSRKLSLPGG